MRIGNGVVQQIDVQESEQRLFIFAGASERRPEGVIGSCLEFVVHHEVGAGSALRPNHVDQHNLGYEVVITPRHR